MNSKIIFACLFIFILIIILIVFNSESKPESKSDYGTFKTTLEYKDLLQNNDFYKEKRDSTIAYLKYVYPKSDFTNFDDMQIATIYNSLCFYYNCCFSYKKDTKMSVDIPLLDPNCCNNAAMPYIPQGWFLDLISYKNNKNHTVFSDSINVDGIKRDHSQCISNTPQIPWGVGDNLSNASGPGPFWIVGYTYIRNIFYPHGPVNTKDGWRVVEEQNTDNYVYPTGGTFKKDWINGTKEGDYIEVTHSDISPGMSQSQGFWMNGFPSGGTGLFYNIGRTKVAINKLDMFFKLLSELKPMTSTDINLPNLSKIQNTPSQWCVDYSNMNGSDFLKHWYGTDDPYLICWKYIAGTLNKTASFSKDVKYDINNDPDPSKTETNLIWPPLSITSSSTQDKPAYLVIPSQWYTFDNCNGILGVSGLMNPYGTKDSSVFDVDNINKNFPFGTNLTVGFLDTVKYFYKLGNNGIPTWKQCKDAIDIARTNKNYYLSRVGVIVSLDEPILWIARTLGYKTLQQTLSSNSNGLWQQEIIDTGLPDPKWLPYVKGRIYPFMIGSDYDNNVNYTEESLAQWMDLMATVITIRDPFDIYNDSKAENAPLGSFDAQTSVIGTCDPTFTYVDPKTKINLCASGGLWNCCKNSKKFIGNTTTGSFFPDTKKCFPQWDNIFHDKNISKYFSQISIFNGQNQVCIDQENPTKYNQDITLCDHICTNV